jgi:transposase-like protein
MKRNRRPSPSVQAPSAFAGFRLPPDVILLAVRWYLRYSLSYRVRSHFHERGVEVDHVTLVRWVQRFTPELIDAARPSQHTVEDRRFVDETYFKVNGVWRYVYRALDQHGQVIDVFVSRRRDIASARRFFAAALAAHVAPVEVITDRAPALANVIEELIPEAFHNTGQYENNRCECDHGRLKARLRPMRGLKTDRMASVVIRGHAFIQLTTRPLRAGSRHRPDPPAGERIRRTPARDLNDPATADDPAHPT